ncbi:enoyl-CoA hydratase-related protein [Streptomyces fractus]|uniref:enoyl-CoA hydratase/isomerase family protein n=1 Tax=Streptomyces fractus TaxID=641806 RepID=UPI003CEB11AE
MTPPPGLITVEELAAGAAHTTLLDEHGTIRDPLVVVDLDRQSASEAVRRRALEQAASCDRLLVGLTRTTHPPADLLEVLDLTLAPAGETESDLRTVTVDAPEAAAQSVQRAATDHPAAAVVLGGLLRAAARSTVDQALDAESLSYSTLLAGADFAHWLHTHGPRPAPPPATADTVLITRDDKVLNLTLNRPERRNAYGRELRDALVSALDIALLDPTITQVILDGNGPSFCSGGDLGEFGIATDLAAAHMIRTRGGAARPLHRLRDRVTVHVHGSCVGAGIELPAFASRIVAAPGTQFRLPELSMGLIPGAGGTVSIPRRIGRWRTLYLVLTGCALPADRALSWGLVDDLQMTGS